MARNWEEFWRLHRNPDNGVYGAANEKLLNYAKSFRDGRKSPSCLDVGAGDGRYTIPLVQLGYNVSAVDISELALERLRARLSKEVGLEAVLEKADILDFIAAGHGPYDLIVCSGLIEELPTDIHDKLILGLQRLTTQDGMNILRYVTEKRLTPDSRSETVTNHENNVSLYNGWTLLDTLVESTLRQAKVGREIEGRFVQRYFRAASLIAVNNQNKEA